MVRVRSQPCSTSFPVYFSKAVVLMFALAGFWFQCRIIAVRSEFLVASYIGDRWYWGPFWVVSFILSLSSWLWNRLELPVGSRNSEP